MNKYYWIAWISSLYIAVEISFLIGLTALSHFKGISYSPITFSISKEQSETMQEVASGYPIDDYFMYSKMLGWDIKPNSTREKSSYTSNAQGARSLNIYTDVPNRDTLRITAFGDSFTHGDDVNNDQAWASQLEKKSSTLEVMNFGVSGFGLDQSLLKYRTIGTSYNSQITFIGLTSFNIARHANVFLHFLNRRIGEGNLATKPRFILQDDELVFLENPFSSAKDYSALLTEPKETIQSLGKNDSIYASRYHESALDVLPSIRFSKIAFDLYKKKTGAHAVYPFLDTHKYHDSSALHLTQKILSTFYREVQSDKVIPIVLLFPSRIDVRLRVAGESVTYIPLLEYCKDANLECIDLLSAFAGQNAYTELQLFHHNSQHYSPLGNRLIAEYLFHYLEENSFLKHE